METNQEKFKAVDFMRQRREELSRLHTDNPSLYEKQLKAIREKYGQYTKGKKNRSIT